MESFENFQELISSINFNPAVAIGVTVTIATFIIECILAYKGYFNLKRGQKKMEKAKKLNHIIKATRISHNDDYESGKTDFHYHAKYTYVINNKKKIYRYLSRNFPTPTLTLYYINNPNKVFHYEEKESFLNILLYLLPFLLGGIVMKLLGYNP